jgi:pantetheine-phosphate adenylyltransferase
MTRIALYPGSFDPPTRGHEDLIRRSLALADRVVVAVAANSAKQPLFSVEERLAMLRSAVGSEPRISVETFEGLLADFAKRAGASVVVRGLRAVSDFEYEFQMALMNKKLDANCETVYLMPSEQYTYLNSSVIREIAALGGAVSDFVPLEVEKKLRERLGAPRGAVNDRPQGGRRPRAAAPKAGGAAKKPKGPGREP